MVNTSVIFKFVARNPPMAMIMGGILLVLISTITPMIDQGTTEYLRNMATWLIIGGGIFQVLWLIKRNRLY